jgi:hypothetical protein
MSRHHLKRASLRSPLYSEILYENEGDALKGRSLNISEGGILLENLPLVPEINLIPLMFSLVEYPDFYSLNKDKILGLNFNDFDREIIRARARMVRKMDGMSAIDKIFVTQIGCEFVSLNTNTKKQIATYVATFAKNTIYLLGLFQNNSGKEEEVAVLRKVAGLLGYDKNEKISVLRAKVLHDYQSLESL